MVAPATSDSRVPPELTDRIIDHLHNNPASLSACSLVCSAWLPRARWHRFRKLTLDCHNVLTFQSDILQAGSDVGSYVECLTVECPRNELVSRPCQDDYYESCLLRNPTFVSPVLVHGRLPALRELRLGSIPVDVIPLPLLTVTRLDTNYPPPSEQWNTSKMMALLPNLRTLLVYYSFTGRFEELDPDPPDIFDSDAVAHASTHEDAPLRQMRVWVPNLSPSSRVVVEELLPSKALRHLHAFSFACRVGRQSLVRGIERRLGRSLRVLELMANSVFGSGECTLAQCTNLQHVRILGVRPMGSPSTHRRMEIERWSRMIDVPDFLAGLRAPNVRSLHFVHYPDWVTIDGGLWPGQSLAAASANAALSGSLRKVVFELYGQTFQEEHGESEAERRRRVRAECVLALKVLEAAWSERGSARMNCEVWWSAPSALAAVWALERTGPPAGAELIAVACGANALQWSAGYALAESEA